MTDSVLRPRDIQARIRSGESPEAVAAAAQTTVDKIMGYATPVLAERAYVAQQAQKASVRRRAGDGPAGHLGEAVSRRLEADGQTPESVEWDAWRREDGRWTLVADLVGGERAHFVYDAAGRYVVAEDEPSRRLVGERHVGVRPGPVGDDGQETLGDDAIEVVTGRRPAPPADGPFGASAAPGDPAAPAASPASPASPAWGAPAARVDEDEVTVDLTDTSAALRSSARRPTQADWITTQASERPAATERVEEPAPGAGEPAEAQAALFDTDDVERQPTPPTPLRPSHRSPGDPPPAAPSPSPESPDASSTGAADDASTGQAEDARRAEPRSKPARAKGRASVPSWDEIMFGSSGQD